MRIAYVCQGGGTIGWGHFSRALTLYEAAPEEVTIVIGQGLEAFLAVAGRRREQAGTESWHMPELPLKGGEGAYDAVVVDDYSLPGEWIAELASQIPVMVVDDWMRERVLATVLLNPNLGADRADYADSEATTWLMGCDYALIRRAVRASKLAAVRPTRSTQAVLVTLGGSDPGGHTPAVVAALTGLSWYARGGEITVILGASYAGPHPLPIERVTVLRDPADFVERCAMADLVICGAGTTSYELALLQRPFLPLALVDNQERVVSEWAKRGVGNGLSVRQPDWLVSLMQETVPLLEDPEARVGLSAAVAQMVDGRGVERVLGALRTLKARQ